MSDILYQKYNVDNVFNRVVIAGLLHLLNNSIKYEQTWQDNIVEEVTVPFAYNLVSNKQNQDFIQDNYTFFGRECFSDKFIDGKFDMLPRFAVTYSGSNIDSQNITNRFVKGTYMKDENGKLTSYTAFLYSIPITMNFDIEGWIDTLDTAFKIEQNIREVFYKNKTFTVLYKGMRIRCCAGFPETITDSEKLVSYSFEQDVQLKMNFSIAVECYQPCFDNSLEIKSENKIEYFGFDTNVYNASNTPLDKQVKLELLPLESSYHTGDIMNIKWKSSSNVADVCTVIVYYIDEDENKHIIDCPLFSHGYYDWVIPKNISKYTQPDVFFINDEIETVDEPVITVHPDDNGYIGTDSFTIVEAGSFTDAGYMQVSLEYIDSSSNLKIYDCYVADVDKNGVNKIYYYKDAPNIESYDFKFTRKTKMKYKTGTYSSEISVGISYPLDTSIYNQIDNILII